MPYIQCIHILFHSLVKVAYSEKELYGVVTWTGECDIKENKLKKVVQSVSNTIYILKQMTCVKEALCRTW